MYYSMGEVLDIYFCSAALSRLYPLLSGAVVLTFDAIATALQKSTGYKALGISLFYHKCCDKGAEAQVKFSNGTLVFLE
ncbi:hypothetical protein N8H41_25210 [Pseudomonas vlassakiae]|uniref:hypothetical protein n=1 Tax=Pseudomonas vlassakiae TaxID=485888 RepID=UPI0021C9038E|nr:hypothetical protein [Pseudomonas vlassakiae]MCU0127270.1 hypothetical protein [Pseudomonas vlassakiae]